MFAYCENNPVMGVDYGGDVFETIFDVVTLAVSVADVINDPSDPWAWAGLGGDLIDLIPFVCGVGEGIRAAKIINKTVDAVDTVSDIKRTSEKAVQTIKYTDKVLKQMSNTKDLNHSFPIIVDTMVDATKGKKIKGGDGVVRILIEIPGAINGKDGVFEYIIDPLGFCNHRFFKEFKK